MFRWADFETAAPMLAAQGRELIERFRFVLVGTIRRRADGDHRKAGTSLPSPSRRPPSSPGKVGC